MRSFESALKSDLRDAALRSSLRLMFVCFPLSLSLLLSLSVVVVLGVVVVVVVVGVVVFVVFVLRVYACIDVPVMFLLFSAFSRLVSHTSVLSH